MAEHDEHSSFIKTPQQLIVIVLLAFVVPIIGIVLTVQLVLNRPHADRRRSSRSGKRAPPAGRQDRIRRAGGAAGGAPRSGEEVVKTVCAACHQTGAAGAPKIGDKAAWAPRIKEGLNRLLAEAIKGITGQRCDGDAAARRRRRPERL
jgi:cytochrome c5